MHPIKDSKVSTDELTQVKVIGYDNVAVERIELYLEGSLLNQSTASPLIFDWMPEGPYQLLPKVLKVIPTYKVNRLTDLLPQNLEL